MNATGFRKILKKWDKRSKSKSMAIYLAQHVHVQPCFQPDALSDLGVSVSSAIQNVQQMQLARSADLKVNLLVAAQSAANTSSPPQVDATALEQRLLKWALDHRDDASLLCQWQSQLDPMSINDASTLHHLFWRVSLALLDDFPSIFFSSLVAAFHIDFNYAHDVHHRNLMHLAASHHRPALIQLAVEHGGKVTTRDLLGRSPIHYAAMTGDATTLQCLLSAVQSGSADYSVAKHTDHDGHTPLLHAIMNGHTRCVELLLQFSAASSKQYIFAGPQTESPPPTTLSSSMLSVRTKDDGPVDPLCLACCRGWIEVVKVLVQWGVDVDRCGLDGVFALHCAARDGYADVLTYLVSVVNQQYANNDGVGDGKNNVQNQSETREAGQDQNDIKNDGMRNTSDDFGKAMSTCDNTGDFEKTMMKEDGPVLNDKVDTIEHASNDRVLDVLERKELFGRGWRPIFYAAANGYRDCVDVLVKAGCRVDVVDDEGWTPWAYALWFGHTGLQDLLQGEMKEMSKAVETLVSPVVDGLSLGDLPSLELPPPMLPVFGMFINTIE
jgi:ankyrin repeat protein